MSYWMKILCLGLALLYLTPAWAVSQAEDIATTIMLRGFTCGGKQVTNIEKVQSSQGSQVIRATCPNGVRYQIDVGAAGRVKVHPL